MSKITPIFQIFDSATATIAHLHTHNVQRFPYVTSWHEYRQTTVRMSRQGHVCSARLRLPLKHDVSWRVQCVVFPVRFCRVDVFAALIVAYRAAIMQSVLAVASKKTGWRRPAHRLGGNNSGSALGVWARSCVCTWMPAAEKPNSPSTVNSRRNASAGKKVAKRWAHSSRRLR